MSLFPTIKRQYVVDIGNTRIHCGIADSEPLRCLHRYDFPVANLRDQLLPVLNQLSGTSKIPISDPVIIAGATKSTMTELTSILNSSSINATPFLFSDRMPFTMKYDSTPGADRVAGMLYCATQFPGDDCIMISAGTAITINVLFKNVFLGGAIFPGVSIQLQSLALNAPALPIVSPDGSVTLPGSTTETCLRSGVLYSIAGGIERIIREYQSTFDTDFVVCATGGDWPYLHRFFDMTIHHDPDMILSGLALGRVYA